LEKKQKIIVATIALGTVGITTLVGLYYIKQIKENLELRMRMNEVEGDVGEIEATERARLNRGYNGSKFDGEQSRWKNIEEDLYIRNRRRNRFFIYDSSDRFKVLKTVGGGEIRGAKRLRVSGDIHKHTPSGYNRNNRNNTPPPNYPHRNNYLDVF